MSSNNRRPSRLDLLVSPPGEKPALADSLGGEIVRVASISLSSKVPVFRSGGGPEGGLK